MSDKPTPPGYPHPDDPNPPREGVHGATPMQQLWVAMSGASAGDHDEDPPGLDPASTKVGHEPDAFSIRGILYVPLAVAIALVVTYCIVQGAFAFVNGTASRQTDIPAFNDRAARISTTDEKADVPQPRLEGVREVKVFRTEKQEKENKPDPVFYVTLPSTPTGNSPELYPQDLRADRYTDPVTGRRLLAVPTEVVKDKVVTLPIADAVRLMTSDHAYKLPARAVPPPEGDTTDKAKVSTGGTRGPSQPKPPAASGEESKKDEHKPEDKKPEEKKPEEKKPEEKKPDEKKPDEKKPDEKKPDDKKPDEKKPEEKK